MIGANNSDDEAASGSSPATFGASSGKLGPAVPDICPLARGEGAMTLTLGSVDVLGLAVSKGAD